MSSLALLLLAVLAVAGCGPSFRPTGYLTDYSRLEFVRYDSDLAWEKLADVPPPDVLYLAPVVVRPGLFDDPQLEADVVEVLRGQLYVWMNKRYGGRLRSGSKPPNLANLALAGRRAYEVELAITEVREGFGLARWLVGFYLGATTLQVEGRLRTLPEREPVGQFACRVVHSGSSYMGLNPKSLFVRYCLVVSADWAAHDISELPSLLFPRWKRAEAEAREEWKQRQASGQPSVPAAGAPPEKVAPPAGEGTGRPPAPAPAQR